MVLRSGKRQGGVGGEGKAYAAVFRDGRGGIGSDIKGWNEAGKHSLGGNRESMGGGVEAY